MAFWLFHFDWMKIMGQGFVTSMAFWLFHSDWMKIMGQGLLAIPFGLDENHGPRPCYKHGLLAIPLHRCF
jgi:hypothetical protein